MSQAVALSQAQSLHSRLSIIARQALVATTKSVTIEIASKDLKGLKNAGYKLCFAKKVDTNEYNVVWQSYDGYLSSNDFTWTPQYELFGSNTFKDNISVKVQTNVVGIGLGQTSVLDSAGLLGQPFDKGPSISVTMKNDYGSIHPGMNQISTGIDGSTISTPIYVAKNAVVKGETALTPVEKVLVWFEQNIQTSTMFSSSRSNSVEIDLTATISATRRYEHGIWTTPQ